MSDQSEANILATDERDYDYFFLHHLQSVHGNAAWYLNHRFVGKGGNGTTFFVTCTSGVNNGFQFALKVFHKISDEQRRIRFLDEVKHYKALSHPSIIKVYDEGTYSAGERSYPFAVMDFIPENLETKLGRGLPQISRIQALRYVKNIVSGVAYLHSQPQPIVHRDIKPANILINGPTARLGDLGLAKVLMEGGDDKAEDVAAYIAMPRFYRTPELVRIANGDKINLTPASDIYQIGLVLYRCITGFNPQKPFRNKFTEPIELDVRPIQGASSTRLDEILAQMLEEEPSKRPSAPIVLTRLNVIHKEVCEADLSATGITRLMTDPWAFGWTQTLALVGLTLTALIAIFGFRTFGRWKREKLEEKRIEIAFEALEIAYESKFVFQHIRGALVQGHEWDDMPERSGDTEDKRNRRGSYYATFKRIAQNKEFFEKVWKLQPKCMVVFGKDIEQSFMKLHKARRSIEVGAQMLAQTVDYPAREADHATRKLYEQMRRDIWDHGSFEPEKDQVGKQLKEFENELEAAALPIVRREYKATVKTAD